MTTSLPLSASALLQSPASGRVAQLIARTTKPRRSTLLVLTYHRVNEPGSDTSLYDGLISATPSDFESQLRWLVRRYPITSIQDVLESKRRRTQLPAGALLLTFDDAYEDFAEHAWPVLRRLNAPVTLFVPTSYPDARDRSFWWDRLWGAVADGDRLPASLWVGGQRIRAAKDPRPAVFRRIVGVLKTLPHHELLVECDRLVSVLGDNRPRRNPVLSWSDIRTLAAEGVAVAPHSRTHPRLDRVGVNDLETEVAGSVADLRAHIQDAAPVFAYPDGAWSPAVISAVRGAGIEMAFTTRRGANVLGQHTPWYQLRRINVGRRTNENALAAQLTLWSRLPRLSAGGSRRP